MLLHGGNRRDPILEHDVDQESFLKVLCQSVTPFHWLCHVYCLAGSDCHLLVETLEPNLSRGMRQVSAVRREKAVICVIAVSVRISRRPSHRPHIALSSPIQLMPFLMIFALLLATYCIACYWDSPRSPLPLPHLTIQLRPRCRNVT